jgi:hypothetical protein
MSIIILGYLMVAEMGFFDREMRFGTPFLNFHPITLAK